MQSVEKKNAVIERLMADPLHPDNVADGVAKIRRFADALTSEMWLLPPSGMRSALRKIGASILDSLPSSEDLPSEDFDSNQWMKDNGKLLTNEKASKSSSNRMARSAESTNSGRLRFGIK